MFHLPWVSREFHETVTNDLREQLRKSELERKELLDRVLGAPTFDSVAEGLAEALPRPGTREAEEVVDSITGALTPSGLRRMAETAAFKAAGRLR